MLNKECAHSFIIPPPNGATSIGICRLCGEEREMVNYIDESSGWRGGIKKSITTHNSSKKKKTVS